MPAPIRARTRSSLAIAALVTGLLGLVPAPAAADAPDPAPDPAPQIRPDPADAGSGEAPAREPATQVETPATQPRTPAAAQPTAPQPVAPTAPARSTRPSAGASGATARASAARSATPRKRDASRTGRSSRARPDRRTPSVAAASPVVLPSGLLLRREPAGNPSGDDAGEAALVLASLALLLLVGASASFLHATTRASDNGPWIRSA